MEFRGYPDEIIVRCPKCKRTVAEKIPARNTGTRPDFEDYCDTWLDWVLCGLFILLLLCIILLPVYFIFKS